MRTFIGIALPPDVCRAIDESVSPFRDRKVPVSWTAERNLHVTMKFLGEIPPDRVAEIGGLLEEVGRSVTPFDIVVEGAGAFPSLRAPRVLWVGLREPLELVRKLQQNMEDVLSGAGFAREERRFHPHVTAGRVRDRLPAGWGETFAAAVSGKTFGAVRVTSFQFYESRLSPSGATYLVLRAIPLAGEPDRTDREEKGP